jgi:hypothetical protein
MALRDMRVATDILTDAAQAMQSAANAIPAAPTPVAPAGVDPLAAAITAHVNSVVAPLIADRPKSIQEASGFAKNVSSAARAFVGADEYGGDDINRSMPGHPRGGVADGY